MRRFDLYGLAPQSVDGAGRPDPTSRWRPMRTASTPGSAQVNAGRAGRGAPEVLPVSNRDRRLAARRFHRDPEADGACSCSAHLESEVLRARISLVLPERAAARPPARRSGPGHRRPARLCQPGAGRQPPASALCAWPHDPLSPFAPRDLAGASNAWAAAPARSAAGGSLLANDPHLGFTAPTIWYLARLELASGGVIGGTIPGIPAVSDRAGPTASGLGADLVLSRRSGCVHRRAEPGQSRSNTETPDGWKAFETRRSIIDGQGRATRSPSPCAGPTTARSCPARISIWPRSRRPAMSRRCPGRR